ncbi:MAG TPA: Crp/Fnr family transcriptional regulator [Thermoanaerobaculia bacterium]|nr:Crp/Fnr family transcriptional regulator [Thermoanaerobaculia bacterium]
MEASDLAALESSPFEADLPPAVRRAMAATGTGRDVTRHQRLFHQGDPASHLWFVASGRVKLTQVGADGQEVVVRFVGPGEIFAGVALLPGASYPVNAEVVEAGRLLTWPHAVVARLAAEHPQLALKTTATIAARMSELQHRFRELATERVHQRIARALLRLARQAGRRTDEGVLIDHRLSRQDLAEMTGTTLFTVSRVLSRWEAEGILAVGRERVVVRDPHRLVAVAEDLGATS